MDEKKIYRFCYMEYEIAENDRLKCYFEVKEKREKNLTIELFNWNKETNLVNNSSKELEIFIDKEKGEEYIEILNQKIYASHFSYK